MADVKWCGHDSRANLTPRKDKDGTLVLLDDIPLVQKRHADLRDTGKRLPRDRYGFLMPLSKIRNGIFIPKYYDPQLEADIVALRATHNLVSLSDLCKGGKNAVLSWETGVEIGKMAYGTGNIPLSARRISLTG